MATGGHNFDIFEREQAIYDWALRECQDMEAGILPESSAFVTLTKEYGRGLKQLRRVTKISDRATDNLNNSRLALEDKVHFDVLTDIHNRRYLDETLERCIRTLARSGNPLSIIMIDIDFFKRYNDTYGHSEGDDCLRAVAKTIANSLTRGGDFTARYGGEEFVVVLPGTEESGGRFVAKRILENIRALQIPHAHNDVAPYVTISLGVTSATVQPGICQEDFIKRADEALYESKHRGRNRYTYIAFTEGTKG